MRPAKVYGAIARRLPSWPCELCGAAAGGDGICRACRADLPWIHSSCARCARPLPLPGTCGTCLQRPPAWSLAIAPLAWSFPVDQLVTRFKYGGALHYGAMLGRLLGQTCAARPADALVPVPLHPARQAERGFNQARELACAVARMTRLPLLDDACRRVAVTPPQAGLSARQRRHNLRGAFRASLHVTGLRVAVVDDVLTTGSTAGELAAALRGAGAADVEVWAVARGGAAQAGENV